MKRAAAALSLVFLVALAVAATAPATALATPGAVTGLTSAPYSTGSFTFSWNPVRGITGYAYKFDQSPGTAAGSTVALAAPPSFSSSLVTVGSGPWQAVTGDFGTGGVDLAVLDRNDSSVAVFLGNGHGGFTERGTFATGSSPQSIAVGDFNGDGRLDLAVANYGAATVSILLGTGVGTFAAKVDYATGVDPHGLAVGDLNGDGKPDLAVANAVSNTVSVLLGKGDGTFEPKVDYATGAHAEKAVIADFNGDGSPDLAVINNAGNSVSMFLGNGDGTFTAGNTYAVGKTPYWLAARDLGNGHLDLVTANFDANTVSVLVGKGDGTFAAKVDYPVGANPISAQITDVNGDGLPDLVVSNHAGSLSVLLGKGDATFAPAKTIATVSTPRFFAVGDFNGDGSPDLAVPSDGGSTVTIMLNTTNSGSPSAAVTAGADGTWYFHVAAVDVNGHAGPTATLKVQRDTTPPATTDNAPSGWQDQAVTVTLKATDSGSGMAGGQAGTWYSLDGGSFTAGTSVQVSGAGTHTLAYYSKDALGNTEQTHTVAVDIDTTPPATTDNAPSGWQNHAVTVTLSATDSQSGMTGGQAGTWHKLDNGTFTEGASVQVGNGEHTLAYYSKDAAGNTEQTRTVKIQVDTAPPVTADNAPSGWQRHVVTVTLHATDSGFGMSGGRAGTWYSLDGATATEGTSVTVSGDGKHTIAYYSKDAGGNLEQTRHATVDIDTHGPRTWALKAVTVKVGKTAKFVFRVNDVTRQVRVTIVVMRKGHIKARIAAGTLPSHKKLTFRWKDNLPKGTYQWKVNAVDQAGNAQSAVTVNSFTVR